MNFVFSTKNVSTPSFIDLCNIAKQYGFSGFEIYEKVSIENKSMLIMRANPSKIKNELNGSLLILYLFLFLNIKNTLM